MNHITSLGTQTLRVLNNHQLERGIPSTVNFFCADDYKKGSTNPKVRGFPNYQINELKTEYFGAKRRSIRSEEEQNKQDDLENVKKEEEKETKRKEDELEVKSVSKITESHQLKENEKEEKPVLDDEPEIIGKSHKDKKDKYEETTYITVDDGNRKKGGSKHGSKNKTKPQNVYNTKLLSQIHSVHTSNNQDNSNVHYVPLLYNPQAAVEYPVNTGQTFTSPTQDNFISVYHPVIDDVCNRVWLLDTGGLNYAEGDIVIRLASIWVIDIPRVLCGTGPYNIRRYFSIPKNVVSIGGGLTNIALDHKKDGNCENVFGYFPNIFSNEICVYDYKSNKAWSFQNHYSFYPVVSTSAFTLEGQQFTENFGVFSITLGWRDKHGSRTAYYISPEGTVQFGVSTDILKDEKLSPANYNQDDFHAIGDRGCDANDVIHIFDSKNGVIFYGDRNGLSVRCWNVRKPPTADFNGVVYYNQNLIYVHGMHIDEQGFLWVLSNKNPIYFNYGFDTSKVNVRIYRIHVDDAIRGTVCANDASEYRAEGVFDYPKSVGKDFIV